jgi:hypothetical protein
MLMLKDDSQIFCYLVRAERPIFGSPCKGRDGEEDDKEKNLSLPHSRQKRIVGELYGVEDLQKYFFLLL